MQEKERKKESILSQSVIKQRSLLNVYEKENRFDNLSEIRVFAYGIGHFINDLTVSCWFNFAFFFLKRIVKTQAAASALLAGQIADGTATFFIGYASDKIHTIFGQRIPWYFVGLILTIIGYLPTFQVFNSEDSNKEYLYYIIFPILYNMGWAALQISHMSLVPSLTCSRKRRDRLNNLRNTFTFVSNFIILGCGLLVFSCMEDPALEYAIISYIAVGLGLMASLFFLYHIREVSLVEACRQKAENLKERLEQEKRIKIGNVSSVEFSEDDDSVNVHLSRRHERLRKKETIFEWFKMPKFYFFGICYMGVRLFTNIFSTLLPFFLTGVLKLGLDKETSTSVPYTVALVPLIVYFNSTVASFGLNWFYQRFGRKVALGLGAIICSISMGLMLLLTPQIGWLMYLIAVPIGICQTMVLSTGINFISDVVGSKGKSGAFVFGVYSLFDKFGSGIIIFWIGGSRAYTQDPHNLQQNEIDFIKYTMVLIPVLASILATLIVISYPIQEYSKKKIGDEKMRKNSIEDQLVI